MSTQLTTYNIARLSHVEGISTKGIEQLVRQTPWRYFERPELIDLVIQNRQVLGLGRLDMNKIAGAFNKCENMLYHSTLKGIEVYSKADPEYPDYLRMLPDAPLILHVKGDIRQLNERASIAIVGTRNPSDLGRQVSERFGYRLAASNINVVSGLALGIDSAAHLGCLKAGGVTTAVLAHGLDMVYPKENKALAERILENGGLLISENWIGTKPTPRSFVARNRIQAGLSRGVMVVETALKGGTMHTANNALEYGRLLAVHKHFPQYKAGNFKGNEFLLRQDGVMKLENKEDLNTFISLSIPGKTMGLNKKR